MTEKENEKNWHEWLSCKIALRNKAIAVTSIAQQCKWPSLSRKIVEIQKSCFHQMVTWRHTSRLYNWPIGLNVPKTVPQCNSTQQRPSLTRTLEEANKQQAKQVPVQLKLANLRRHRRVPRISWNDKHGLWSLQYSISFKKALGETGTYCFYTTTFSKDTFISIFCLQKQASAQIA